MFLFEVSKNDDIISSYVHNSSNTEGVLTWELQEECVARGILRRWGMMLSYGVAVRHHRFWGLQSHTTKKHHKKENIAMNKKQYTKQIFVK